MRKQIVAYSYIREVEGWSGVEVRYWVDAFEEKSGHHALRID